MTETASKPPAQPVRVTLTEAEKRQTFSSPSVLPHDEVFAMGQPQTVDEARAAFRPTMQGATGPVTRELDKRGWLPDIKPAELTPSR